MSRSTRYTSLELTTLELCGVTSPSPALAARKEFKMTIDEAIAKYKFYHCIELQPGIFTPGWKEVVPLQAPVLEVIKEHDLRGKRVLDIGCRDGLFSFAAEKQGGLVLGIDNDLSKAATEFLIPLFQSSVIIKELNLYDFQVGPDERFD